MVEQLQLANLPTMPSVWIILASVLLLGVLAVLVSVFGRTQQPPEDGWKGIFYYKPDDPALFVPKRYGIGYTLNFGNSWSWVVLALILAMVALPIGLSIANVRGMR